MTSLAIHESGSSNIPWVWVDETYLLKNNVAVRSMLTLENRDIFEWLSQTNEDGSITITQDHPILDGHFGKEKSKKEELEDVGIVPGVYLRSLALGEYRKNGGKHPIEWLKFSFVGMVIPNDTLVWDNERKGFYKSADSQKNLCIQVEEVSSLENTIDVPELETIESQLKEINPPNLDNHLPQKPPFRFAEKYTYLDNWMGRCLIGSMQINDTNQRNGKILEEFAAQTLSYHYSVIANKDGFRIGNIGTFESSQTHFDDKLISSLWIGSKIYVVWYFTQIRWDNKNSKGNFDFIAGNWGDRQKNENIMEYSLLDSNGTVIGFGRLTGLTMPWKAFQILRKKIWRPNKPNS